MTPHFGLALDRTWEMIVGTAVPVILLAGIEVVLKAKEFIAPEYMAYISGRNVRMRQENAAILKSLNGTNSLHRKCWALVSDCPVCLLQFSVSLRRKTLSYLSLLA